MATCSPNTLLAQAASFQSCDDRMLQFCIIQLLCNIQAGGGTGGGATVGSGSPEGAVTANPGAFYWDTTNGFLYIKDNGTGNTGWAIH